LATASAQATLLYQFDWDANSGTGTAIADASGFGTADSGVLYDQSTPTGNFVASTGATASPNGGFYGNFATDDRRNISSFGTKWNDGTTGIVATDAVTITMLLRDVNLTGGDGVSGALFHSDNGGSFFSIEVDKDGTSNSSSIQLNVGAANASTSAVVDLSNSTTGNGWILLAATYSLSLIHISEPTRPY